MDKIDAMINELLEDDKRLDAFIKKEEEQRVENNERKENLIVETNALKEDIALKEEENAKIKDEPHRLEKGAYIFKDSCLSLERTYKENEEQIKEKNRIIADQIKD